MIELKRLEPTDTDLYKQAWGWDASAPRWFQRAKEVFTLSDQRIDIAVFDEQLVAVIMLTPHGPSMEVDLLARRGTDVWLLGEAAFHVKQSLFTQTNIDQIYCWLPKRNKAVSKVCILGGMVDEGVRMIRGSYGKHVIEWVRWVVKREQVQLRQVA